MERAMSGPDPKDYDDPDKFEADWRGYNEGGQTIQVDSDEEGNIDPDSLIGPLPGLDDDDDDDDDE
jgi:hypothetical protein